MLKSLLPLTALAALACGPQSTTPAALPQGAPSATPPSNAAPTVRAPSPFGYPDARRDDVVDNYHGVDVADPYRWLEDPNSDETKQWIAAQNEITGGFLETIPHREGLRKRLTELWNYERYGIPSKQAGHYVWSKNDGLQPQSVYYMSKTLSGSEKVLFDPNKWSDDGTVALAGMAFADNGRYVAYGVATAGSDWRQWKVRDLRSGKDTKDVLDWIKFGGVSWSKDNRGFYYSRYPAPKPGAEKTAGNFNQKLYYHRLGTAQSDDRLIHETPKHPKYGFGSKVTEDGRYLIISTWKGTGEVNLVHVRDLRRKGTPLIAIAPEWIGEFAFLGNDKSRLYFKTNYKAPKGRVIAIDIRKPEQKHWQELVAEGEDALRGASIVGNTLFVTAMHHATTQVIRYDLKGKKLGELALPGLGKSAGFGGKRRHRETFYSYTSFTEPSAIYRYDLRTGKSTRFRKPEVKFDGSAYETRQVFYKSKDGTKVPMFLVHKKGLELDGTNPTLLYGYGGFSVSLQPSFSVTKAVWLEQGGVYALANLRGGGEYGEDWHKAGTKLEKQNVFDDFIAAAEYLIREKVTSAKKLAIMGGSNGGLLVGAVLNQRPELFGAAVPAVGVMDMLRYHKFTIGWAWIDDYGSSDDPEEFEVLRAYSPYHNVKETSYPSVLVTTADHDDRVVPGHSFKYAAALQRAQRGESPVMIRIETRAGHGAGKPTAKRIEEAADIYGFILNALDAPVAP